MDDMTFIRQRTTRSIIDGNPTETTDTVSVHGPASVVLPLAKEHGERLFGSSNREATVQVFECVDAPRLNAPTISSSDRVLAAVITAGGSVIAAMVTGVSSL